MSQRSMNVASFVSAGTSITPAALHRLARDDADRLALEPGEAAEHAGAVLLGPRLHAVRVEDRLEHLAHVVAAARVAGNEREQLLGVARGRRRVLPAARVVGGVGEVGEHALDRRDRRVLVVDDEVGIAALRAGDLRAAELVARQLLADRSCDHRRPGEGDRRVVRHHDEVPHRGVERRVAEARADNGDQARDLGPSLRRLDERPEVERQSRRSASP